MYVIFACSYFRLGLTGASRRSPVHFVVVFSRTALLSFKNEPMGASGRTLCVIKDMFIWQIPKLLRLSKRN